MSDTNETSPPDAAPPEGSVWKSLPLYPRDKPLVGTVDYNDNQTAWRFIYAEGRPAYFMWCSMSDGPNPSAWRRVS